MNPTIRYIKSKVQPTKTIVTLILKLRQVNQNYRYLWVFSLAIVGPKVFFNRMTPSLKEMLFLVFYVRATLFNKSHEMFRLPSRYLNHKFRQDVQTRE